VYLDYH
jgi:hypothetical protein